MVNSTRTQLSSTLCRRFVPRCKFCSFNLLLRTEGRSCSPNMFSEASCRSFRLLCFLVVALGISTQGADGQGCTNVVPGLDKMTRGIDISSFDLYGKNQHGLRQSIVHYTCKNNKKKVIDGTTYDVPDQVDSVTSLRQGLVDVEVKVIRTYSESREATSINFGVQGSVLQFGFSSSLNLRSMHDSIFKDSRYVETVSAFESAQQAQLVTVNNLEMSSAAKVAIDTARLYSNSRPFQAYKDFVENYGTHFFHTANFGGILLVDLRTKSDYYREHSEEEVKVQARASFLNILKTSGGYEGGTKEVDEAFKVATVTNTKYYGGSANLLDPNGYKAWQPTVPSNPWLFSGKLIPISDLIQDTNTRRTMEKAVTHTLYKTHLDELTHLISSRRAEWSNGLDKLQELQTRVDNYKNNTWLTDEESAVKSLSTEVLSQITVPGEFVARASACYSWYNDGNGQCSGPTSRVCASPSMMLPKGQDQTTPVICPFAWSLKLKNHDSWFGNLQLCFRWDQCREGGNNESCMSINQLTTSSDLDLRRKGVLCQKMSWKIEITETMPVWQQNSQLCFVWRPDNKDAPCGGELCAQAGTWTDYDSKMKLLQRCISPPPRPSYVPSRNGCDSFPKLGPLVLLLSVLFHASRG